MESLKTLLHSIGNIKTGILSSYGHFRRYGSTIATQMVFLGNVDTSTRGLIFEIGPRHDSATAALATKSELTLAADCSIQTNAALATDFSGYAKKYSNFSGIWEYMDLSAVIERLAKSVAAQSMYGNITTAHMRGGRPLSIYALGVQDRPISATTGAVFIPRIVDVTIGLDIFAVLVAAVNGSGGSVYTDVLTLDANSNAPIVPVCQGPALAAACIEALRILGANYSHAGAGDVFAYAVAKGIHSVASVVGHTDEGGYVRDVFRSGEFPTPYGGIHFGYCAYPGLPALASLTEKAVSGWVDAIALKTAAAVAHADPCMIHNGMRFPRFYNTGPDIIGTMDAIKVARSRSLTTSIAHDFDSFSQVYCDILRQIFMVTGTSGRAAMHMNQCAGMLAGTDTRHLYSETATPFFWIEPTSILPHNAFGTEAEAAGFASLAAGPSATEIAAFETGVHDSYSNAATSEYTVMMRNARTSGLLLHLAGHRDNGLGAIRIVQADVESILQVGAVDGDTAEEKFDNDAPISSYMWTRGQSPLPAPGEMINVGGTLGLTVQHWRMSDTGDIEMEHVPAPHEFINSTVTIRASTPEGLSAGPANTWTLAVKRQRTRASAALSQTVTRMRALGIANVGIKPKSKGAPKLFVNQLAAYEQDTIAGVKAEVGIPSGPVVLHQSVSQSQRGLPIAATMQHAAGKGPLVVKQRQHTGGGNVENTENEAVGDNDTGKSGDQDGYEQPVPIAAPQ